MSLLKDCPRCFWLQFNKGIKRPAGIFPSLPSGMDKIIKIHFDDFRSKELLPPELKELEGVKLFDNLELLSKWRNNRSGISWEDKNGTIIKGAVDDILVKGKKLIVLDFKTRGFPLKEDTSAHYLEQLSLYNFILQQNGYSTEDYSYLLFYHPNKITKDGHVDFHIELIKMKTDAKDGEKLLKNAVKVLNSDIPKASDKCEYCVYFEGREKL